MKENFISRTTVPASWTQTAFAPQILRRPFDEQRHPVSLELQQLKSRLLRPLLEKAEQPEQCHRLRLAANEALADAMTRPSPHQALPCLLEAKVREVQEWFRRQQRIRDATRTLFQTWSDGVDECWSLVGSRMNPSFR